MQCNRPAQRVSLIFSTDSSNSIPAPTRTNLTSGITERASTASEVPRSLSMYAPCKSKIGMSMGIPYSEKAARGLTSGTGFKTGIFLSTSTLTL